MADRTKYPFLAPVRGAADKGTLWTPAYDARFPSTNQTRNCWSNYVEYQRCRLIRGDEHSDCLRFLRTYTSLCPVDWIEQWDEQRENGIFPGQMWEEQNEAVKWRTIHAFCINPMAMMYMILMSYFYTKI